MFRILKMLVYIGFGIYLGTQLSTKAMQSECGVVEGEWKNGVCLVSERPK